MIGSAAGIVTSILPVEVIPRTAEGFRARVVFIFTCHSFKGTLSTHLLLTTSGSHLSIIICLDYTASNVTVLVTIAIYNCCFPPVAEDQNYNQTNVNNGNQQNEVPQVVSFPDEDQMLILWPHHQVQTQATVTQNDDEQREDLMGWAGHLAETVAENIMGLPDSHLTSIQIRPNNNNHPNLISYPHDLFHHRDLNSGSGGGTLVINDPNEEGTPPRRGRGRPLGALNKNRDVKEKGKAVQEIYGDYEIKNKKRKLINEESPSSYIAYTPETIQEIQIPSIQLENLSSEENSQALDLVSQMLANPELTNILIKKGAINPKIINRLSTILSTPLIRYVD
ncbi:hypothetical protein FRX31_031964 [Thalictrum thalictroides]|uniref:Uncharacterized protein n=1 Tax=Thalictrum thalictroides TaxID=46969 RepID=A0A7J6V177_THATH|nr:hypothetical protein FRX31_031964 [Thalictrum thalictroides]